MKSEDFFHSSFFYMSRRNQYSFFFHPNHKVGGKHFYKRLPPAQFVVMQLVFSND